MNSFYDDIFNSFIKNLDNVSTKDIFDDFDNYFYKSVMQGDGVNFPRTNEAIEEMNNARTRLKNEWSEKLQKEVQAQQQADREARRKNRRADAEEYENGQIKRKTKTLDDGTTIENFYDPDGNIIVQKQLMPDGTREVYTLRTEQEMNDMNFDERERNNHRRRKRTTTSADGKTVEMSDLPDPYTASMKEVDIETGEYRQYKNRKRAGRWSGEPVPDELWETGNLYEQKAARDAAKNATEKSTKGVYRSKEPVGTVKDRAKVNAIKNDKGIAFSKIVDGEGISYEGGLDPSGKLKYLDASVSGNGITYRYDLMNKQHRLGFFGMFDETNYDQVPEVLRRFDDVKKTPSSNNNAVNQTVSQAETNSRQTQRRQVEARTKKNNTGPRRVTPEEARNMRRQRRQRRTEGGDTVEENINRTQQAVNDSTNPKPDRSSAKPKKIENATLDNINADNINVMNPDYINSALDNAINDTYVGTAERFDTNETFEDFYSAVNESRTNRANMDVPDNNYQGSTQHIKDLTDQWLNKTQEEIANKQKVLDEYISRTSSQAEIDIEQMENGTYEPDPNKYSRDIYDLKNDFKPIPDIDYSHPNNYSNVLNDDHINKVLNEAMDTAQEQVYRYSTDVPRSVGDLHHRQKIFTSDYTSPEGANINYNNRTRYSDWYKNPTDEANKILDQFSGNMNPNNYTIEQQLHNTMKNNKNKYRDANSGDMNGGGGGGNNKNPKTGTPDGPEGPKGSPKASSYVDDLVDGFKNMSFLEKVGTVGNVLGAVSDYKSARQEGHGVVSSVVRAGAQFAFAEAMGIWYIPYLGAKALPKGIIKGADALYKENRRMNSASNQQVFGGAQFQDTQQLATMRQSGMEMAKMAQYNLQQTLMGQEATYLHR